MMMCYNTLEGTLNGLSNMMLQAQKNRQSRFFYLVPEAGLEPTHVHRTLPPQDSVSTNSTTSAKTLTISLELQMKAHQPLELQYFQANTSNWNLQLLPIFARLLGIGHPTKNQTDYKKQGYRKRR